MLVHGCTYNVIEPVVFMSFQALPCIILWQFLDRCLCIRHVQEQRWRHCSSLWMSWLSSRSFLGMSSTAGIVPAPLLLHMPNTKARVRELLQSVARNSLNDTKTKGSNG